MRTMAQRSPLVLLSLTLLCLCLPLRAQPPAPTPEELEKLTAAIAAVQARIERDREARGEVEAELRETERGLAAIAAAIKETEDRIAGGEAELDALRGRADELEALKDVQREEIARYLRSAYLNGRQEYLKLLLNQEDAAASARTLRYYQYFAEARTRRIAGYNATLTELESLRAGIEQAALRLRGERGDLARRQAELTGGQARRLALLDELDQRLAQGGSELERLRREREEMEFLIEELQRSITELPLDEQDQPFAELKGQLPWPADGALLNRFGERHTLGDLTSQGITIGAQAGAEVRAVHHGRVLFADWFAGSGLLLIIDHGDGYMSLYAHNQTLFKEVGDWVSRGEAIAAAGDTGGRRQSGVYFEIRRQGRSEDPIPWLSPRN